MSLATPVRRTASLALWVTVLWCSWQSIALFSDGASFFAIVVHRGWFDPYDDKAREYAIWLTQIPLVIGFLAGTTDLHWLARLFSLGSLVLPALLYQLALVRAKDDPLQLAMVLAAIASAFMPSFLFSVGEYNTAYAAATAAAVFAARRDALRLVDGIVLLALAVLAVRSYEAFVYLGPLIGAMIAWRVSRASGPLPAASVLLMVLPVAAIGLAFLGRPPLPIVAAMLAIAASAIGGRYPERRGTAVTALHLLAAAIFMASAAIAIDSIGRYGGMAYGGSIAVTGLEFWQDPQSALVLAALAIFALGAFLRPALLSKPMLYVASALPLVLLAMLPLVLSKEPGARPLTTLHYGARTAGGFIVAALVCFAWLRASDTGAMRHLFQALEAPSATRRCLALSLAMMLATVPSNLFAVAEWTSIVETVRSTVRTQQGAITIDRWPPAMQRFYWDEGDRASLPILSQVLRAGPSDGIVTPPETTPSVQLFDLGRYLWRD